MAVELISGQGPKSGLWATTKVFIFDELSNELYNVELRRREHGKIRQTETIDARTCAFFCHRELYDARACAYMRIPIILRWRVFPCSRRRSSTLYSSFESSSKIKNIHVGYRPVYWLWPDIDLAAIDYYLGLIGF